MNRRRFLALTGAAVTGLWLAGTGLIALPRLMIIAISGRCSFCDKAAAEVFGLTGVTGYPTRICNECIELCLEIIRDDLIFQNVSAPPPTAPYILGGEPAEVGQAFEVTELLRNGELSQTRAELRALLEDVRKLLQQSEIQQQQIGYDELSCSFCERKQSRTRKLIAGGARAYICDVCISEAAALLIMHC